MAREYSQVYGSFWTGETGRALRTSPDAQRVAMYLISAPTANMIGFYYLPLPTLQHEVGITEEGAKKALRRLSEVGFCRYDALTEFVFVREMARWQLGPSLKVSDNRHKNVIELLKLARKCPLLKDFRDRYGEAYSLPPAAEGEGGLKPLLSQEPEPEKEPEQEKKGARLFGDEEKAPPADGLPPLPPELDNAEFRAALDGWLAYKRERREAYKPAGLRSLIATAARMARKHGAAAVAHAMEAAAGNNWAGWNQTSLFGGNGNGSSAKDLRRGRVRDRSWQPLPSDRDAGGSAGGPSVSEPDSPF